VEGRVIGNKPHVTRIGEFEVDVALEGLILAYYQIFFRSCRLLKSQETGFGKMPRWQEGLFC